MNKEISKERREFIRANKREAIKVKGGQFLLLSFVIFIWQLAADMGWIDTFIMSSPKDILKTIKDLLLSRQLLNNAAITMYETLVGFLLGLLIGTVSAIALWWFPFLNKVLEPYIIVINAMPKVALGPIIIIWAGAGMSSIIIMTLLISTISTIIGIYGGFCDVDEGTLILLKTFGANKAQILFKVLLPASFNNFISMLKINIGLSWVGVIMGEFLVSKAGLGYLIMYGSQVFNLTLVMTGILLVSASAALMYFAVYFIEKSIKKRLG